MEIRDRDAIGIRGALLILAITFVLAILTYRYVETPLQKVIKKTNRKNTGSNRITVAMGAGLLIVGGLATTALTPSLDNLDANYQGLDPELYPGAAQFFMSQPAPQAEPFPPLEELDAYRPAYVSRDCQQRGGTGPSKGEVRVCEDENKPEAPTATIVLAGGSHAGHLEAAFQALGKKWMGSQDRQ